MFFNCFFFYVLKSNELFMMNFLNMTFLTMQKCLNQKYLKIINVHNALLS